MAALGTALLVGVVVGVGEGLVSRWISLFFVFPLLLGMFAGIAGAAMVGKLKLRAPALALLCGFLGGAGGYASQHVTTYIAFRAEVSRSLAQQNASTSEAEAAALFDELLTREVGTSGLIGYLELNARTGVKIKRTQSWDKGGLTLTGIQAWLLWAAELLTCAIVAGVIMRSRAKEPFCESCDAWFSPAVMMATRGAGSNTMRKQMLASLEGGDLAGAARAFYGPSDKRSAFQLTVRSCPSCGTDVYMRLERVMAARKKPQKLESWLMSKSERDRLKEALDYAAAQGRG